MLELHLKLSLAESLSMLDGRSTCENLGLHGSCAVAKSVVVAAMSLKGRHTGLNQQERVYNSAVAISASNGGLNGVTALSFMDGSICRTCYCTIAQYPVLRCYIIIYLTCNQSVYVPYCCHVLVYYIRSYSISLYPVGLLET